jgi:NAD(P)-dependent dehydrogenase (short-subunit alcohol dehydrogenase family)
MASSEASAALVTGGAQGIGRAISLLLARKGWRVLAGDTDKEAGAEIEALDPHVVYGQLDVASETSVAHAVGEALDRFGRLDALINNAGFMSPRVAIETLDLATWNRVIGVNLTGAFLCAKYATPHLKETHGAIVNIASTRALQSEADTEPYSASKGGLVALTHALAVSLSGAVRVNCISPGWIETSAWKKASQRKAPKLSAEDHAQHPAGRVGTPDDIAAAVAFLLSEDAGFITGANFVIDGGMTRKMIYAE